MEHNNLSTPLKNSNNSSNGEHLKLNNLYQIIKKNSSSTESALVNITKKLKNNDSHFKTLKDSINNLRVSLFELKKENTALRTEVDELRDRVEKLEKLPKVDDISFDLNRKVQDRISKERNVLVFNMPEQQPTLPIFSSYPIVVLNKLLEVSNIALDFTDATWLGNISKNNGPQLIEFEYSNGPNMLLRGKMNLRNLENWKYVCVNGNQIKKNRLKMIKVRTELRMIRENGESGLVIKYVNGEPTIVSNN